MVLLKEDREIIDKMVIAKYDEPPIFCNACKASCGFHQQNDGSCPCTECIVKVMCRPETTCNIWNKWKCIIETASKLGRL